MQVGIVGIADVELGEKGLAVGSCCRAEIKRHGEFGSMDFGRKRVEWYWDFLELGST
jgi:hypothetical protein